MGWYDHLTHAFNWVIASIEHFFGKVEPALEAWLKKFLSDEGKILLGAALKAAEDVTSGESIQQAADNLISTMASQGLTVAKNDALDAIRTQLSYLQEQPTTESPK